MLLAPFNADFHGEALALEQRSGTGGANRSLRGFELKRWGAGNALGAVHGTLPAPTVIAHGFRAQGELDPPGPETPGRWP